MLNFRWRVIFKFTGKLTSILISSELLFCFCFITVSNQSFSTHKNSKRDLIEIGYNIVIIIIVIIITF